MENNNFHHEPKATDGFSTTEKVKAVVPGTAENRAKQAAQERLDGELPHSIIQATEGSPLDQPIFEPKPIQTNNWTTGEKLKGFIPGTIESRRRSIELEESQKIHEPKATDGFTTGEKLKSFLPGTAEHRAKEAAQERINGHLPYSVIAEVGKPPISKVE